MAQYVYTMHRLSKVVPPKREILKNISLSFFPGAKIGVLGLNGSGKSTLLKIMAGVDTEFDGEARPMPELNVGYLPQEPQLDPNKTVREVVEEAVSVIKDAQARLDQVYAEYAEPDADFDKLAAEQAKLESILQASDGHNRSVSWKSPPTRCACRPGMRRFRSFPVAKSAVSRCAACCSPHRICCFSMNRPTTGCRLGRLAGAFPPRLPGNCGCDHARPLLRTTWLAGFWNSTAARAFLTRATIPAGLKPSRTAWRRNQAADRSRKSHERRAGMGTQGCQGASVQIKARLQRFEEMQSQEFQKRSETNEIYIPAGPRLGDKVIEFKNVTKGYGDRVLIDNLSFSMPKGAIVGVIGGNGAGKSTLFRMLMGKEQPDSGSIEVGETVQLACVDQSRDDWTAANRCSRPCPTVPM